jgi:hypothetical protein
MERKPLSSSSIASVGYDPVSRRLEIEFHNGSLYEYFSVPQATFKALITASSAGRYLNEEFKKANYPFRRLR